MTEVVWVLSFDAHLDDAGDYVGYTSVHSTRDAALDRLQADWNAATDEGCTAADIDTGRGSVSYGISRHPVE